MDQLPATVVWLAPESSESLADKNALAEWAIAHDVILRAPVNGALPDLRVTQDVAELVEEELARAHDALSANDVEATERALARAEAPLRLHPELPQAAWLMAEVFRGWASRWLRLEPRDELRAEAAWQRAAGLDGDRSAGVGEAGSGASAAGAAGATSTSSAMTASIAIDVRGDYEARLDGAVIRAGKISTAEGEHALVVSQGGVVRFAEWVAMAPGASVRIRMPTAAPCSTFDLAAVRLQNVAGSEQDASIRAEDVRCASWVAVAAGGRAGAIRVATCQGQSCGPLIEWRVESRERIVPLPAETGPTKTHGKLPTWASLALFGAGIFATSTVAILVSDAAHKPDPETHFVNGGVKTQRFAF